MTAECNHKFYLQKNKIVLFGQSVSNVKSSKTIFEHGITKKMSLILIQAAKNNDVSKIKELLSQGADINVSDEKNLTPLHSAAFFNKNDSHYTTIELLLMSGADVNARTALGNTPIYYSVNKGNVKTVKLLLNHKADPNIRNNCDNSPLIEAICSENINLVQLLLDHGADVNSVNKNDGATPLHTAAYWNNAKLFKCLLRNGAQLNVPDRKGLTPLKLLCNQKSHSQEILMFLLKYTDDSEISSNVFDIDHSMKIWKNILEHIAKMNVLNLKVCPSFYKIITGDEEFENYFQMCEKELLAAKSCKLENSWITFFNLLVDDKKKLKNYAGNVGLVENFKNSDCLINFPIYGAEMQKKIEKGLKRRELFDRSSILLSYYLPIFNPNHLIVRDVFDCILSIKDLLKFSE